MTQNITNITQAIGYGGEIPGMEPRALKALPKMQKVLEPLANEKGAGKIESMDKKEANLTYQTVLAQAKLFDLISKQLP